MNTWSGTWVALVTPFRDGEVDTGALRRLVQRCIGGGVDGLVACGTTGEAPALSAEEYALVVRTVCEEAHSRQLPVLAGTGTNSTAHTIERTALARELGCDGALVVTPYYNRPSQAGLVAHYSEVARQVPGFPIVLYDVPSRTGVRMAPETVETLSKIDEIVAIKDATGDVRNAARLVRRCGRRLTVLSGDDALALPMYAVGARGVISVAANVVPDRVAFVWDAWAAGDTDGARRAHAALEPLFEVLFAETNPAPCKAALGAMGLMHEELRLPLVTVQTATRQRVLDVLRRLEIPLDAQSLADAAAD